MSQVSPPKRAAASRSAQSDEQAIERERARRLDPKKLALLEQLHERVLEVVDLPELRPEDTADPQFVSYLGGIIDEMLADLADEIPPTTNAAEIKKDFLAETFGLGPLEDLLSDQSITEILVIDRQTIFVERGGRLSLVPAAFGSDTALRTAIERIIMPLGRRIDESQPLVDARLKDGSRVNAIIPPLALRGAALTIRKFSKKPYSLDELMGFGALDERMKRFLIRCVQARKNIVVSGGTGSGKTTLLNALAQHIDRAERIVTIEDSAELRLMQPHVVSLETRPPNFEGQGAFTIRDLVRNSLRMRPDRIVVGECRGGEALDMLQAMNTGHDGSLTTLHANNPSEAVSRLETLCLMAGLDLPARAIRAQIANAVHVILQQSRFSDGSRRITGISEVLGLGDDGDVVLRPLFTFQRFTSAVGAAAHEKIQGRFRATGYVPSFMAEFYERGLIRAGEGF